jgi:hypothetical protein
VLLAEDLGRAYRKEVKMDWTKKAEDAALAAFNSGSKSDRERLRAALDAAVKAQGLVLSPWATKAFFDAIDNPPAPNDKLKALFQSRTRAEALEEAAKKLESLKPGSPTDIVFQGLADEIRNLK